MHTTSNGSALRSRCAWRRAAQPLRMAARSRCASRCARLPSGALRRMRRRATRPWRPPSVTVVSFSRCSFPQPVSRCSEADGPPRTHARMHERAQARTHTPGSTAGRSPPSQKGGAHTTPPVSPAQDTARHSYRAMATGAIMAQHSGAVGGRSSAAQQDKEQGTRHRYGGAPAGHGSAQRRRAQGGGSWALLCETNSRVERRVKARSCSPGLVAQRTGAGPCCAGSAGREQGQQGTRLGCGALAWASGNIKGSARRHRASRSESSLAAPPSDSISGPLPKRRAQRRHDARPSLECLAWPNPKPMMLVRV